MQPIAVRPKAVVAPTRLVTMEDFMKHRPTKFSSKATLDEADAWMRECEKICEVLECQMLRGYCLAPFFWWQM